MSLFITRGNYTSETIKNLMAKPEDRAEAVGKLLATVGGKLTVFPKVDYNSLF